MLAKRPFLSSIILLVLGLAFGATLVTGFGSWGALNRAFGSDPQLGGPLPKLPADGQLENLNNSFEAIAKAVQPTVVCIKIKTEAPKIAENKNGDNNPFHHFFQMPFGDGNGDDQDMTPFEMPQQGPEEGLGSGVIVTSDGYILTNNHVVENAAKKGGITIKLTDKREFEAKLIGTDPTTDLAVVKIDATGLPVAALGNSDDIHIGEWVMAVGNPLDLESTVTAGIVSSLGRAINLFDRKKTQNYGIENFIQTDAAINPGNSGGGLFNMHGAVIGINAAIASRTGMFAGYGFAIPINMAKTVAMDLIKTGKVNRGYIGVNIREIDQTDAEALGMDHAHGVRVDSVVRGSAGEAAGIRPGDVILTVNGHEVNAANELQGMIGMHHAGDEVTLSILRDGKEIEKVVTLKPRPDLAENTEDDHASGPADTKTEDEANTKQSAKLDNIGLAVQNLTPEMKDKFGVKNGVVVTGVLPTSEAYDRGLGPNQIITSVGHTQIHNSAELEKAINANKGKAVGLTVYDNKGNSHWLSIKVPE